MICTPVLFCSVRFVWAGGLELGRSHDPPVLQWRVIRNVAVDALSVFTPKARRCR